MAHEIVVRTRDKHNEGSTALISPTEDGARRCLSCRWFVGELDSGFRRCKHEASEHRGKRHFLGCKLWESWL